MTSEVLDLPVSQIVADFGNDRTVFDQVKL